MQALKNLPKVNKIWPIILTKRLLQINCPREKNSPNLVTLFVRRGIRTQARTVIQTFVQDHPLVRRQQVGHLGRVPEVDRGHPRIRGQSQDHPQQG